MLKVMQFMRRKPTSITVYSVHHLWKGTFKVEWSDTLNYPRTITMLYRRVKNGTCTATQQPINDDWCSGEAHPTGVHNSGLIRKAPKQIADALDNAEIAHLNNQP